MKRGRRLIFFIPSVVASQLLAQGLPISGLPPTYGTSTIATLRAATVPITDTIVMVAGYYTSGDGGGGAFHYDPTSTATENGGTIIAPNAGSGRWLRDMNSAAPVSWKWFGAIGDNASHPLSRYFGTLAAAQAVYPTATSLTNEVDGVAIQSAVDCANSLGKVSHGPPGIYLTSDTIHLGYGINYSSMTFEGEGKIYRAPEDTHLHGTAIVAKFSDRPAINVQGARLSTIRGLSIIGKLGAYVVAQGLGGDTPLSDDTVAANWHDTSLASTQDSRYAPYAGITIDGYSGPRPATSYPDVTYPASLGTIAQYGKKSSSDVTIQDCYIGGFVVGVVNQPCAADENGDFTKLWNCYIERCKWGVSVGNSQSRIVDLNNVKAAYVYCALTNRRHGKQIGKFGGNIRNLSTHRTLNLIDFNNYAAPIVFTNLYAETLWKIGTVDAANASQYGYIFDGCEFSFGSQNERRGVPANVLDNDTTSFNQIDFQFNGGVFRSFPSVVGIFQEGVGYNGVSTRTSSSRPNAYEQFAHNALAGGIVNYKLNNPRQGRMRSRVYNLSKGSMANPVFFGPIQPNATRNFCASLYANQVQPASDPTATAVLTPARVTIIAKRSLATLTLSGTTLTMTFSSRSEGEFGTLGPLPGDVIWDEETGTTFFVNARSALVVTATMQNNYKSEGAGGVKTITPFSTANGSLYIGNSRAYSPQYLLRGDTTAGTTVLTKVARDDGVSTWISSDVTPGDWVYVNGSNDNWLAIPNSTIASLDAAAGTITVSGNALRTEQRRQFGIFFRQAPANFP